MASEPLSERTTEESPTGISIASFAERRRRILLEMADRGGGIALFFSAPEIDSSQSYRQDSDLYYVTGCQESNVVCLLTTANLEARFVLFLEPRDAAAELWTGVRIGIEGAKSMLGADAAYPIAELENVLPEYLQTDTVFCRFDRGDVLNERLLRLMRRARSNAGRRAPSPTALQDIGCLLDDLRTIKNEEEQQILRTAGEITSEAHRQAMQSTRPGQYEYEVQAVVEYNFLRQGASHEAYPSIVGSGPNATTLHYEANSRRMVDGDLLLIDAGAQYKSYAMDLTRTMPVNGRFTLPQRKVYTVVLAALEAAVAQVRPGNTLETVHDAAVRVITAGLVELGLLQGDVDELITAGAFKRFYMHATSHWVGLDVHDRGRYQVDGAWRPLEPGMVLSVEPGIYIAEPISSAVGEEVYESIGVRIEDTVLVTPDGCEVLTATAPKDPDAIEALMAAAHD
jgi:Xaa-Pro aminopeptidase